MCAHVFFTGICEVHRLILNAFFLLLTLRISEQSLHAEIVGKRTTRVS